MTNTPATKKSLSLGAMFKNGNASGNPRSPNLVGKLTITPETFRKLFEQFEKNGGGEIEVQLAAWFKIKADGTGDYLSVQLSEPYERPKPAKPEPTNLAEFMGDCSKSDNDNDIPPWEPGKPLPE